MHNLAILTTNGLIYVKDRMKDTDGMQLALQQARKAFLLEEVPVGAVIVQGDRILSATYNQKETLCLSTAHAEVLAIEQASQKLGQWRLTGCSLYVTLEPCLMCAGAIVQSRLSRVIIGALDPKAGAVCSLYQVFHDSRLNHQPDVLTGVLDKECSGILKDFFQNILRSS